MTIIFQKGNNFWIESLITARTSIAATTTSSFDSTLERPGIFLGASLALDIPTTVTGAEQVLISAGIRQLDNSELVFGDNISTIRTRITNQNATAEIVGTKIIVYLRKIGSGQP